jgi:tRNA nucleotidyltransferase (CCA-adding enzyme)
VISVEQYNEDIVDAFESSLIILDPIDTTRNLGTAISTRNVARLMLSARNFLSKPSFGSFQNSTFSRVATKKLNPELLNRTVVVMFKNHTRSVDILWGELRKSLNALAQHLEHSGFEVLRSEAVSNEKGESALLFLFKEIRISGLKLREGPEVYRKSDVQRFIAKNLSKSELSWIDPKGNVNFLFDRERKLADARKFLEGLLSDSRQRASIGLSKQVQTELGLSFRISTGSQIFKNTSASQAWIRDGLQSILTGEIKNN